MSRSLCFQINVVQALSKCTGWQVLSSSNNLGCGPAEPLGCGTGCLLSAPAGDRLLAIRCGHGGDEGEDEAPPTASVYVGTERGEEANGSSALYGQGKWTGVPGKLRPSQTKKVMACLVI